MSEEWRKVFDGHYSISNLGRLRRETHGNHTRPGFILRGDVVRSGYLLYRVSVNGVAMTETAAALVAQAFIGPRPEGLQINHKNGVKLDNRPENLEYVTASDNLFHACRTGLKKAPYGDAHYQIRFPDSEIPKIIARKQRGEFGSTIAKDYGCHYNTILQICRGIRRKHAPRTTHA